jgi:hypothetical protein
VQPQQIINVKSNTVVQDSKILKNAEQEVKLGLISSNFMLPSVGLKPFLFNTCQKTFFSYQQLQKQELKELNQLVEQIVTSKLHSIKKDKNYLGLQTVITNRILSYSITKPTVSTIFTKFLIPKMAHYLTKKTGGFSYCDVLQTFKPELCCFTRARRTPPPKTNKTILFYCKDCEVTNGNANSSLPMQIKICSNYVHRYSSKWLLLQPYRRWLQYVLVLNNLQHINKDINLQNAKSQLHALIDSADVILKN